MYRLVTLCTYTGAQLAVGRLLPDHPSPYSCRLLTTMTRDRPRDRMNTKQLRPLDCTWAPSGGCVEHCTL